jgi:8-oxo-dGTP pyrophosphatase MutT (NUDIX family)
MTYDEKVDLLSLDFGQIWHRFQLFNPDSNIHGTYMGDNMKMSIEDYEKYKIRKTNFERTFLSDKGKLLRKLIAKSHSSMNNWEIPKGRKNGPEKILNCAIRETSEETGLYPTDYNILLDEEPLKLVQPTPTARYESYYFIAVICDHRLNPRVPERLEVGKPSEIAEIQWMTIEKISVVDVNEKLTTLVKTAFKIIRVKYNYDRLLTLELI